MKSVRRFLSRAIVVVVLTVLVISGILGTAPQNTRVSAQEPEDLVIGHSALPAGLDPAMDGGLAANTAYLLIYDRLIEVDKTGSLVPNIALSWTPIEDTIWELKIREDVHFHNGEVLDAEDVAFSLQHFTFDEDVSRFTDQFGKLIESVEAIDSTTVHIKTIEPWALAPARLVLLDIIPKDYFEEVGGAAAFSEAPVGSGPYSVVDWEIDNYIEMERFDDYWKGASGPEKVTIRLLAEQSSRVTAIEAGEIDVATTIDPEQALRLEENGFNLVSQPTGQVFIYFFRPTLGGPIADERVRQAINYAVDVDAIVDTLFFGFTEPLQGQPATPAIDGFNPDIEAFGYDPELAKSLLAEAGYADGFSITLDTTSGRVPKDLEVAEIVAAMLADVGITVNIEVNESGVYFEKLFNGEMHEMWALALNAAPSMTLENPSFNFTSFTGHQSQADPAYDELQSEWSRAFDLDEREQLAHEMLQYIHDEAWGLFLWPVPGVHVTASNAEGFKIGPDYKLDLSNVVITAE